MIKIRPGRRQCEPKRRVRIQVQRYVYRGFNYLDDCLRRLSQVNREDHGLFNLGNNRQENDYNVELSASKNTILDKR